MRSYSYGHLIAFGLRTTESSKSLSIFLRGVENLLRNEHPQLLTRHNQTHKTFLVDGQLLLLITSFTYNSQRFKFYRGIVYTVSFFFKVTQQDCSILGIFMSREPQRGKEVK